nr:hypothetical protein [Tanacetum cinerariifolium]
PFDYQRLAGYPGVAAAGTLKSVGIVIPKALYKLQVVGFGVCPRTSDPKLVKISVVKEPSSMWVVEVFTLSRRIWETVYMGAPFKSCDLIWIQVSIDGVIYWRAYDDEDLDVGFRSNFIISFDLKSDTFGEVRLLERLVYTDYLLLANMNESLVLLEYNDEPSVCGVWMRKDAAANQHLMGGKVALLCQAIHCFVLPVYMFIQCCSVGSLDFLDFCVMVQLIIVENSSSQWEALLKSPVSGMLITYSFTVQCATMPTAVERLARKYLRNTLLEVELEKTIPHPLGGGVRPA